MLPFFIFLLFTLPSSLRSVHGFDYILVPTFFLFRRNIHFDIHLPSTLLTFRLNIIYPQLCSILTWKAWIWGFDWKWSVRTLTLRYTSDNMINLCTLFILFMCSLFKNAFSLTQIILCRMTSELWIGKDMENKPS